MSPANISAPKPPKPPVYSTTTRSTWVRECEREYDWWTGDDEWVGCWRDVTTQYQSGTSTSYSRGAKIFEGRFRVSVTGMISITAELEGSELVVGDPTTKIK